MWVKQRQNICSFTNVIFFFVFPTNFALRSIFQIWEVKLRAQSASTYFYVFLCVFLGVLFPSILSFPMIFLCC
jgi:hypothetical protein